MFDELLKFIERKYAHAILELNKATRKVEKHKGDIHWGEGAQLLVNSLKKQLQDAQCELQKIQDVFDPANVEKVQELRMRVDRLSLTIQTVDGVVVGIAPTSPGYESQDILENAK